MVSALAIRLVMFSREADAFQQSGLTPEIIYEAAGKHELFPHGPITGSIQAGTHIHLPVDCGGAGRQVHKFDAIHFHASRRAANTFQT